MKSFSSLSAMVLIPLLGLPLACVPIPPQNLAEVKTNPLPVPAIQKPLSPRSVSSQPQQPSPQTEPPLPPKQVTQPIPSSSPSVAPKKPLASFLELIVPESLAMGETAQLVARVKDATGQLMDAKDYELEWTSSQPTGIGVDAAGRATGKINYGFSDIYVHVVGTTLVTHKIISLVGGSSGGGGGGAAAPPPPPPPVALAPGTPVLTSLSATADFNGSTLTLTGTDFDATAANNTVKFGNTAATVTAATATSLTVTVPAGLSGAQPVTVTVNGKTSAASNFEIKPDITTLSAANGVGGDTLTITGTGYDAGTAANNKVKFGNTQATVTAATATTLTITVPSDAPSGVQNVSVQVGHQTSGIAAFSIKPVITSLSASAGIVGSSLTITGSGFDATPANNTVKFGTITATVTTATPTSLTLAVPANASGLVNVTNTVGGQTNTGTNNFAVRPNILSMSGVTGKVGSSVTLTGTGFDALPANNIVMFGLARGLVTAATGGSLTVNVPNAAGGSQNVTVQVGTQTSNFTIYTIIPEITALNSTAGSSAGKLNLVRREVLTISGTGFDLVTLANNTVKFGGTPVAAFGFSGQDIKVLIPVGLTTGDLPMTVEVFGQTSNSITATVPVVGINLTGGYK
ncbi:MAG: IPT/TIG domain-containing protein [Candidatus Sericytochromatia bacterium]|nr:IPT/TIG domain-containing protein [Candidatus Sericytochromatia bacterium]